MSLPLAGFHFVFSGAHANFLCKIGLESLAGGRLKKLGLHTWPSDCAPNPNPKPRH